MLDFKWQVSKRYSRLYCIYTSYIDVWWIFLFLSLSLNICTYIKAYPLSLELYTTWDNKTSCISCNTYIYTFIMYVYIYIYILYYIYTYTLTYMCYICVFFPSISSPMYATRWYPRCDDIRTLALLGLAGTAWLLQVPWRMKEQPEGLNTRGWWW